MKETELQQDIWDTANKKFYNERGWWYYYDKKGLLKEIRRLDDNEIINRYRYEFY